MLCVVQLDMTGIAANNIYIRIPAEMRQDLASR